MIKVPRNFFTNLTPKQYREYLKLLPNLSGEKAQAFTMIIFTLAALIFFGIFAINPTISTIVELKRQYSDLQFVNQKLVTKMQNLSTLLQKYQFLSNDLPVIYNALPQKPEIPKFLAQINALISRTHLTVRSLRTYGVEITPDKKAKGKNMLSFIFSLEAEGSYDDMIELIRAVTHFNRMTTIEMVSITKDTRSNTLILNLRGRQYFKP